jgi:hypothetical protein
MNNKTERNIRIRQAMAETRRVIDRAMRYSPGVRDHALIESSQAHLAKLEAMIAEGA